MCDARAALTAIAQHFPDRLTAVHAIQHPSATGSWAHGPVAVKAADKVLNSAPSLARVASTKIAQPRPALLAPELAQRP